MRSIYLSHIFIQLSAVALLLSQLSVARPQYGKHNHQGHRHGHGHGQRQQQEQELPPPCRHQSGEENYSNSGGVPPDSSRNQEPDSNSGVPPNGQPGLSILPFLPAGVKFPPETNIQPTPPQQLPSDGIQIIPSQNPVEQQPQSNTCPEGSGLYKKTGLCYKFASTTLASGELSPCGSFMEFYKINGSHPPIGECDCKSQHLGVPRPIAYWEKSDECYWLFDQGPCKTDEWLVLNENDRPICNKRSCPENSLEDWSPAEGNKKYWFRNRGKCYKSDEKGFCKDQPEHKIYLTFTEQGYSTECKKFDIEMKTLLNGAKPLPCLPGHKASATGECRKGGTVE